MHLLINLRRRATICWWWHPLCGTGCLLQWIRLSNQHLLLLAGYNDIWVLIHHLLHEILKHLVVLHFLIEDMREKLVGSSQLWEVFGLQMSQLLRVCEGPRLRILSGEDTFFAQDLIRIHKVVQHKLLICCTKILEYLLCGLWTQSLHFNYFFLSVSGDYLFEFIRI